MQKKLYTQTKDTQKLSSVFSNTPVQGMFESRSFIVQPKQQGDSQQPDLKTSLMQAERYGHHLQQTYTTDNNQTSKTLQPNKQTSLQKLPIQQRTLVIGGPANATTLDQIADPNHPSYDQYIGNAYKYAVNNRFTNPSGVQDISHIENPPLRIPDKFGGRKHKWNPIAKIRGNKQGTPKHGPKRVHQPQGNERSYLNDLGNNQTLDIMAHGTRSGKIGGYKTKELADLLENTGLRQGQQGTINLRACLSAKPRIPFTKSPALKLETELQKRGINMNVQGFKHFIQSNQQEQKKDINIFNRGLNTLRKREHPTVEARLERKNRKIRNKLRKRR